MPIRVAVLGAGAWGTATALLLARRSDHQVTLWSARADEGRLLRERRENVRLLPGIAIPESILLTDDPSLAVADATIVVTAVPTVHLRATMQRFRGLIPTSATIVSLTKGIENQTFLRPTEILTEVLGCSRVAALSGPSHAEEVSRGLPTSVVIAAIESEPATFLQQHFQAEAFRVYTNSDLIGVELAGALKNVIGIAAGICDGLGFGDNAKSALLTRGLVEMARFGIAHGAEHATFQGLAGMGDLITTCVSKHGRNRAFGERVGRGESPAEILAASVKVVEGVPTARAVHERAARMGIDVPIMRGVYEVLFAGKAPIDAVADLLGRRVGSEKPG